MANSAKIYVEVAYALPEQQRIIALEVNVGCTAYEAAVQSGIAKFFPGLDLDAAAMGVFGKAVKPKAHVMQAGERVEIYRPLIADPKEARKKRAEKVKARKEEA